MKKAFIFSMDAFLAIILFIFVIFIIYTFSLQFTNLNQQYFFSEDLLTDLSNVKINDLDLNNYPGINQLITSGKINNTDISLVEQIVTFKLNNDDGASNIIISNILSKIGSEKFKSAIYIGSYGVYGNGPENSANIISRTRLSLGRK